MNNEIVEKKSNVFVFLIEFIRIRGVVIWSMISLVGFVLGMTSLKLSSYLVPLLTLIVSTFCILSFTFAINNYYDADSDRENPRRKHINAIASGKISKKTSIFLNVAFVSISLLISLIYRLEVLLFCVLLIFWMWVYSSPPIRLKGRPGLDIIWHFFAFVLLTLWGSLISGSIGIISWLVAISFGMWSLIAQVWNHISDYSYDKDNKTITFAVWTGIDTAKTTLKMTVILHVIFLFPLIIFYSLSYLSTIIILIGGLIFTLVFIKPKKDFPISPKYHIPFVFACVVYLNCVIYHICTLLEEPTIRFLSFTSLF